MILIFGIAFNSDMFLPTEHYISYSPNATYLFSSAVTSPPMNSSHPNDAYMRQWIGSALGQILACR